MSEMLGNHYFLVRDYSQALKAYLRVFSDSFPQSIIKKIIICYLTQDDFVSSKNYFLNFIKDSPASLKNTVIKMEDCPCSELIKNYESNKTNSIDEVIRLGILWSYCDLEISKKYFESALKFDHHNKFIQETLDILNKLSDKKEKEQI